MNLSALTAREGLSAAEMTIRAQALRNENPDRLRWSVFYAQDEADNMQLREFGRADFAFVTERRPYNTQGLELPEKFGELKHMLFLPIQIKKTIDEEEIQMLNVPTDNERMVLELMEKRIPDRVDKMVLADERRLEVDGFHAWATGNIKAKNYQTKQVALVSYGFASERYQSATTPWSDSTVNSLAELIAWLRDARSLVGTVVRVYMDGYTLQVLLDDAPTDANDLPLAQGELEQYVSAKSGREVRFAVDDQEFETDLEGGKVRRWPVGKVAAVPEGFRIGQMRFAPVSRASDLIDQVDSDEIEQRDVTVFYVTNDDGTQLQIQAQLNAYPAPRENDIAVMDNGITAP